MRRNSILLLKCILFLISKTKIMIQVSYDFINGKFTVFSPDGSRSKQVKALARLYHCTAISQRPASDRY